MQRLFDGIINHRKAILVLFALLLAVSVFLIPLVSINYDLGKYLPEDSPSTIAYQVMTREFQDSAPNLRVMARNVTVPQALELKDKLRQVEGVQSVRWLDDVASTTVPLSMLDPALLDAFYKDSAALYQITATGDTQTVVAAIRDVIGPDNAMAGSAVNVGAATSETGKQMTVVILLVIPLVLVILLLATRSYFEPVLFFVTIAVAVAINMGANAFFDNISFVTAAACAVLQLAVSMDYCIFLLHRFTEYRDAGHEPVEAMRYALRSAFSSVLGSGLTTLIGFCALILMQFRIGADLGIVMAKSIVLSLLAALVLLPGLALLTYPLIDKTHHRPFLPGFGKFGRAVFKLRFVALLLMLILIVPSFLANRRTQFYFGASHMFDETTQVGRDSAAINNLFGESSTLVLLVPLGNTAGEVQLSHDLHALPFVKNITSYVDTVGAAVPPEFLDEATRRQLLSEQYSRFILTTDLQAEGDATFTAIAQLKSIAGGYYDNYYLAGEPATNYDMHTVSKHDLDIVNYIAIAAILLVLLIMFRALLLPFIVVLAIETAIWINLAVPYFANTPLFFIAFLILSAIQLGATVDYAILFTNRYLEERESADRNDAVVEALRNSSLSILTSGLIFTSGGLLLSATTSQAAIKQIGLLVGRGAALSTAMVLLVLPALLWLFDRAIFATMKRRPVFSDIAEPEETQPPEIYGDEQYDYVDVDGDGRQYTYDPVEEQSAPPPQDDDDDPLQALRVEVQPTAMQVDFDPMSYEDSIVPDQSVFDQFGQATQPTAQKEEQP